MNKYELREILKKLKHTYLKCIDFQYMSEVNLENIYEDVNRMEVKVMEYALKQRDFNHLKEESGLISKIYKYTKYIKHEINKTIREMNGGCGG
ncbi:MAG: hypothetical protein ACRCUM_02750 [Mycoplasmoidaceae bacterium]